MEYNAQELDDHGPVATVGRYILHRQIARGGMATIHIARLMGDEGFSRIVAAKRLLPEFAEDQEFVAMFLDEARIASKVHHRNVVPVLDVVTAQEEVLLVQEYVHGAPLHWLLNRARQSKQHVPVDIAVSIACQVLSGLHAAHDMVDELGMPLNVVHRDVSPQNVMIATDGSARLLDFGVAKATMAAHVTREGTYKGKLAYSAPEQLRGHATRQSDIYSLAVLLWELLVGHRMHGSQSEAELVATIMNGALPTITDALAAEHEWESIDDLQWRQLTAIEPIVKKGLAVDVSQRWQNASDMEEALVALVRPASLSVVGAWLKSLGKDYLEKHDKVIAAEEASWRRTQGANMSSVRRTPVPGELRSVRYQTQPGGYLSTAANRAMPVAPAPRKGPYALVALLSALVIALAVGIVLVVKAPTNQSQAAPAAAPVAAPATAVTPPVTPAAAVVPPSTSEPAGQSAIPAAVPPAPAPPSPSETVAATTEPEASATATKPEAREATPAPTRVVRRPVRAPARVKAAPARAPAAPEVAPPPAVAPPPEKPANNCNPPYYFDGNKKIFKPACL